MAKSNISGPATHHAAKRRRIIIICLVVAASLALTIGLAVGLTGNKPITERFPSDGRALDFFGVDDGLKIKWSHGTNSKDHLEEALSGDYMMIEGDIQLRWYGYPNVTDEPIMAHPPDVDSDNTLDNWLTSILERDDKGPKLDFKSIDVVEPSLELLLSKEAIVSNPIWANADVVRGPVEVDYDPIDHVRFLSTVNRLWPAMTLSLGWTTACCVRQFTQKMMEDMWEIIKDLEQPVTLPARAALLRESWPHFKWLLTKDTKRLSITVWTPAGVLDWEGTSIYDLLYVRNDCNKSLIYYDLPGPRLKEYQLLSVTAGSVFNHFDFPERDGLLVTWAHAVNTRELLEETLKNSSVLFLEADVMLYGQGTPQQNNSLPVMSHDPPALTDFTLEEWLTHCVQTNRGLKLDFKSIEAVEPAMIILAKMQSDLAQPVWINADIFRGPGATPGPTGNPVNATEFLRVVTSFFPYATLSIGWKTGGNRGFPNRLYTPEMINEMAEYSRGIDQPITFPIRACYVRKSWSQLRHLLDLSRSYTMTIWSSASDDVSPDDMVFLRRCYDQDRVFYDLPEQQMNAFITRLHETEGQTINCTDRFPATGRPLDFFMEEDGLSVTWLPDSNNMANLDKGLHGNYMMLAGSTQLRDFGQANQTREPMMVGPYASETTSDNTLENWLVSILTRNDKGVHVEFESLDVVRPALELLARKTEMVGHPISIGADVVTGPGSQETPINSSLFLEAVNELYPNVSLALGWTSSCCGEPYTSTMINDMLNVVKYTTQPVTFLTRVALVKQSWEVLRVLLQQPDSSRFTLTIWTPPFNEGSTIYDLLYARNDQGIDKIYYNLGGSMLAEFKMLAITGGTPLNHFPELQRDAMKVTWAHAVNTRDILYTVLQNDTVLFLEADVMLYGQGTAEQNNSLPVMSHDPPALTNFTLEEFVTEVAKTNKGIKLDFKSIEAVDPAMKILKSMQEQFKQSVWINADVFAGPGGNRIPVNATEFQRIVVQNFPYCTLSVGWTTGWNNSATDNPVYTEAMVDEMAAYAATFEQPITFPIRATMVEKSWDLLKTRLLDTARSHSLTIWTSSSDEFDYQALVRARQCYDVDRIYYDLPEHHMNAFLDLLNKSPPINCTASDVNTK